MLRSALILLTLAAIATPAALGADQARRYYEAARRAQKAGDTLNAYLLAHRASSLEPQNAQFANLKTTLQVRANLPGETETARTRPTPSKADLVAIGEITPSEAIEAREALEPPRLKRSPLKKTFDLRGEARTIIEQVATAYAVQVVFGGDYQPPPPVTYRMTDAGMEEAFRALELVTNSFFVPISEQVMIVERDTIQRRADTSPAMAVGVPIPERMSVQEAQEIVTAIQQTLEIRRISVDPGRRLVFMRDLAAKVIPARQLFHELSRLRAQVEIEVELLSTTKTSSLGYGLGLQTESPIVNFGDFMGNVGRAVGGFTKYIAFGGGATFLGFGVGDASILATLTRSSAQSVLTSTVVAVDGQAAQLHVGDRYPIITNGYYGQTNGTGKVYTPPPTVNFQDLGLVLKVTPTVHSAGEMSLELEAEYNVLGADTANNIPVISRRKYQGKVRLQGGQWGVIAGLVKTSNARTGSGLPFPILRKNTIDKEDTELILLVKPKLTNLPPWEEPIPTLWVGTESKPLTVF